MLITFFFIFFAFFVGKSGEISKIFCNFAADFEI